RVGAAGHGTILNASRASSPVAGARSGIRLFDLAARTQSARAPRPRSRRSRVRGGRAGHDPSAEPVRAARAGKPVAPSAAVAPDPLLGLRPGLDGAGGV